MKNTSVIVALICGVSLVISAALVANAIKSYGGSLVQAAQCEPRISLPTGFTVDLRLSGDGNPMRFDVTTKTKP
jgi:hypothetical protein